MKNNLSFISILKSGLLLAAIISMFSCSSSNTGVPRFNPHKKQPTITYGDPAILKEAYNFIEVDVQPVLKKIGLIPFYGVNFKREATVTLLIVIDEKGDVIYVETVKPVLGLNEAVVEAVLNNKYSPGEKNGKPVKVSIELTMTIGPRKLQKIF